MNMLNSNYRWGDAHATHTWIEPVVLAVCRRLRVRSVLDLGCGNGALCGQLVAEGYQVAGCDPSRTGIEIARQEVPQADFFQAGVYDDPGHVGRNCYDCVIATEVVEHLYYPRSLPPFARDVLRPGGCLIASTPYHGYFKNLALSLFNRWDHTHTVFWDDGHIKFFSEKTFRRLFEEAGFRILEFYGVGRVWPFYKNMILVGRSGSETCEADEE